MISYPLDFSKPWSVLSHNKETQKVIISGHSKDIHISDGKFGGNIIVLASYRHLKLSKENTQKIKYARRKHNEELVKSVYEHEISSRSINKNN